MNVREKTLWEGQSVVDEIYDFNVLGLSSIGGPLYFNKFRILVWSPYHKFKFEEDLIIGC